MSTVDSEVILNIIKNENTLSLNIITNRVVLKPDIFCPIIV